MASFRKINLNALRVAESAARLGSFTKASEEQLITPSAVSQRISRLEDELQFKIFSRKGNLIELTHQGAKLIGSIREPLDNIDLAGHTIAGDTQRSIVRLCIPQSMAVRWLLPKIPSLQESNPDIFVCVTSRRRFRNFVSNDFDCAIQFGSGKIANAVSKCLFQQNMTPVCSPEIVAQIEQRTGMVGGIHPSHLSSTTLLHSNQGTASWDVWLDHENLKGVSETARHAYFDSKALTLEAAKSGIGFALIEREKIVKELELKQLVAPFCRDGKRKLGWHFLKPDSALASNTVAAFEDWLLDQAEREKLNQQTTL